MLQFCLINIINNKYTNIIERERIDELDEDPNEKHESAGIQTAVNDRLVRDELEESGKLTVSVAHNYENMQPTELVDIPNIRLLRDHKVHKSSITCLVVSSDGKYLIAGSKDGGMTLWGMFCNDIAEQSAQSVQNGEKNQSHSSVTKLARVVGGRKGCEDKHIGHCTSVNCIAITTDSKFIASGDDSNLIIIWKISVNDKNSPLDLSKGLEKVHVFRGHRSPVSGLAFRIGSHTLYSCAHDRSVKVWNLDEMGYVETLFGHQDKVTGIDAGIRERVLTSGGRDGTVRIWKIVEESQLVYNAPTVSYENSKENSKTSGVVGSASVDAIKLLDEQHFITCGEDGHVSLWNVSRKKPVCTIPRAHGSDPSNNDPRWISAIATKHNTDLIASASSDGVVRLWKCTEKFRSLVEIAAIPVNKYMINLNTNEDCTSAVAWTSGFVNAMCFHPNGRALIIGIGQEHRLGRWWRFKEARNGILVIPLCPKTDKDT